MTVPALTYLTVDPVAEGVGRSQVLPYVERLGRRGVDVTLHSFEQAGPDPRIATRLEESGVRWRPHRFGAGGAAGGLARVARGASALVGADLVHARSDLAAAAAMVARRPAWVWDMRAFWREQRMALGLLRPGSPEERVMRSVEGGAARSSAGIVTLSEKAVEVLGERFGPEVGAKCRVITTCVDLDRFTPSPLPSTGGLRFLLAGTLNRLYDVPAMVRLVERVQSRRRAGLTVLTPDPRPWQSLFGRVGATAGYREASAMPEVIAGHHVGLCLLHPDHRLSSAAAMPTKLGEFLACGRPVAVSPGMGDMDELLARHDCGVVVDDLSTRGLDRAADALDRLAVHPGTPGRCRALAEEHFDLDRAVDGLIDLYRTSAGSLGR